ncbi:hypothetical protein ABTD37_20165, partial [Acinetobacter baumannii]
TRDQMVELTNAYFDETGASSIYADVTLKEFDAPQNQESLEKLWRKRNLGSFDKVGFARVIAEHINDPSEIPDDLRELIVKLCSY